MKAKQLAQVRKIAKANHTRNALAAASEIAIERHLRPIINASMIRYTNLILQLQRCKK